MSFPSGDQVAPVSWGPEVSWRAGPPAAGDGPEGGFVVIVLGRGFDQSVDDAGAVG